jgi:two-component system sensor kinase FixL
MVPEKANRRAGTNRLAQVRSVDSSNPPDGRAARTSSPCSLPSSLITAAPSADESLARNLARALEAQSERASLLARTRARCKIEIARRKLVERTLRDTEEQFRQLVEYGDEVFWLVEPDLRRILYVSPSYERIWGRPFRRLYTHAEDWLDGIHEDDRQRVREAFAATAIKGHGDEEYRVVHPDGTVRWVHDRRFPIRDGRGAVCRIAGIAGDITERKQLEEALTRQVQEQQAELAHLQRLGTMGEIASLLAHELSQPLAAITNYVTGCVRQLRSRVGRRDDLLEMMEEAAAEALRGGEIIRHLWDFVHKRTPEREPADVNQLVRDVTRLIGVEADQKGIAIHLDLSVDLPRVQVDRVQVEQVLVNLIRNGLEAMHESDPETASLTVRTTMAGPDSVEISVRDHGEGLPADLVDAVFAPFVTTKPNGLGMGLSISRSIAEAHGGRVWLTADSNGATTARFTLPVVAGGRSE